jgi:hypothetical protein
MLFFSILGCTDIIAMNKYVLSIVFLVFNLVLSAQIEDEEINDRLDSLFIDEIEEAKGKDKVLHAEPLFIDLIRDLGARKGEKEWNIGMGIADNKSYDSYSGLVEYEFAPADRLGMEIELPFSFYYPTENSNIAPSSKLNSIKLASQYTFLVSQKAKTSAAIGYIHEFALIDFQKYGKENLFKGNVFNPFLIVAKRWGQNFHTLIYSGPHINQQFNSTVIESHWQINSNIHYMIDGTRNFIGIEFNKDLHYGDFDMSIRPQMRVSVSDNLLIGIVAGIPVKRENERFSTFIRLIYEPGHKNRTCKPD